MSKTFSILKLFLDECFYQSEMFYVAFDKESHINYCMIYWTDVCNWYIFTFVSFHSLKRWEKV